MNRTNYQNSWIKKDRNLPLIIKSKVTKNMIEQERSYIYEIKIKTIYKSCKLKKYIIMFFFLIIRKKKSILLKIEDDTDFTPRK